MSEDFDPGRLKQLLRAYLRAFALHEAAKEAAREAQNAEEATRLAYQEAWRQIPKPGNVGGHPAPAPGIYRLEDDWSVEIGAGDYPIPIKIQDL